MTDRKRHLALMREARRDPGAQTAEGRLLRWCLAMEARLCRLAYGPTPGEAS